MLHFANVYIITEKKTIPFFFCFCIISVSNPDLRILATSHASVFSFNEFGEVVDVFDSQDNLRIRGIALDHYIPMSNSGSHSPSFVYSVERDSDAEFYRQFLNMTGPVHFATGKLEDHEREMINNKEIA